MARNHVGHMALYEAVNKERFNAAQKKELSRLTQGTTEPAQSVSPIKPVTIPPQQPKNTDVKQTVWAKKPKLFGINNGRIEFLLPYPIAITIVMALALLLIGSFRIGQAVGKGNIGEFGAKNTDTATETTIDLDTAKVAKEMARSVVAIHAASSSVTAPPQAATATDTGIAKGGELVIVLAELKNGTNAKDLEPAKQYFDEHGISTEIKVFRGSYFLVTTEKYDSVGRGTPGAAIIEKIGQVGAKYKAPSGYGGFGSKPFSDAYGRKM
jgi:hypothetical protein